MKINLNLNSVNKMLAKSPQTLLIEQNWINSKNKIIKNLLVIGFAWILLFTAFQSMANLQSSLNSDEGLGTASLCTIYITLVISCFFLPPVIIDKFGLKWSIVFSQFTYLLYIAANIYPKWFLLLPTAALLGIGAGPLWTAKCTYLTEIAGFYSKLSGESNETVVNRFFGIFFCMFQMSQIIGNLISSTILKPEIDDTDSKNLKLLLNNQNCGFKDCPGASTSPQIKRPQSSTVYLLCFIFISLVISSILLIIFSLNSYISSSKGPDGADKTKKQSPSMKCDLLVSTVLQIKNKYQLLIIPLTLWLGFSLAFIGADFTKSFVACTLGVDQVGYIMICFGATDMLFSYGFGTLFKYIGRMPCFLIGALINYLVIYLMMNVEMNTDNNYMLYLIPSLWGVADGCWQTQVNSLYGVLFKSNQEAAFSNFRLWESVGFAVSYAYSNSLCIKSKLHLLIFYLTFGVIGYVIIEILENNKTNQNYLINFIVANKYRIIKLGVLKLTIWFVIFTFGRRIF